ncbi:MAG: Mut7-C ubiquitin/RNAse domain-containing protein [Anaerolineales bacterium]|nr:Mut7-C ubiquitin/RNAse domain-containing protein [Chloroflexota bacterium]MBL6983259.1 Mut7-C ubiquitin/RNAse domain-containing protein [Anaerolineales bacterium]
MPKATFRFYAELNDFLPLERRQVGFEHMFGGHETVKHLVESLGVPHTEVDLLLINGVSVGFDNSVEEGDQVSVYPVFESMDIKAVSRVRPEPLREPRFVLDGHLGKLAKYLRLMGFDTLYRNDFDDHELAEISSSDRRILLTRDRGLLKHSRVTHGYCIRAKKPKKQVNEVLQRFDLHRLAQPFSRCARCNGILKPAAKADVYDRLEPKTKHYFEEFSICPECDQIYWKGSHFKKLERFIDQVLQV